MCSDLHAFTWESAYREEGCESCSSLLLEGLEVVDDLEGLGFSQADYVNLGIRSVVG